MQLSEILYLGREGKGSGEQNVTGDAIVEPIDEVFLIARLADLVQEPGHLVHGSRLAPQLLASFNNLCLFGAT
jgi:hypothetical protein